MKKIFFLSSLIFFTVLFSPIIVRAESLVVSSSALVSENAINESFDLRVKRLENFLKKYQSPLTPYAKDFIKAADKYEIDWRLVPAITGVESTFGKRIPAKSYNAYGWANGNYKFSSWEESIEEVTKALREKYYNRGAKNIYQIAKRYAPPSNTWAWKVEFFMEKIDATPVEFDL